MDQIEQLNLEPALQRHRTALIDQWYEALDTASPVPLEAEKVQPHLADLTDQLIAALTAEAFEPTVARDIGAGLYGLCDMQAEGLVEVQLALAQQIVSAAPAGQVSTFHLRLMRVLSNMMVGFLAKQSRQIKKYNMESVAKMGHDLKTPINSITGFSRVILKGIDGPITDFQKQDLDSIYNAGKVLLDMINELTQVSKQDESKQELYLESFEIASLIGDVLATIQPLLAEKGHTLVVRCTGDLGVMHANISQVRWVALSMLLHAARDMEPDTLWLAANREMIEGVDWVFFRVSKSAPTLSQELAGLEPGTEEAIKEESDRDLAFITGERFCADMGGDLSVTRTGASGITLTARIPAELMPDER